MDRSAVSRRCPDRPLRPLAHALALAVEQAQAAEGVAVQPDGRTQIRHGVGVVGHGLLGQIGLRRGRSPGPLALRPGQVRRRGRRTPNFTPAPRVVGSDPIAVRSVQCRRKTGACVRLGPLHPRTLHCLQATPVAVRWKGILMSASSTPKRPGSVSGRRTSRPGSPTPSPAATSTLASCACSGHRRRGAAAAAGARLAQTWNAWRMLMPTLAEGFQVIAVDQRGIGLSDLPGGGRQLAPDRSHGRAAAAGPRTGADGSRVSCATRPWLGAQRGQVFGSAVDVAYSGRPAGR
jgi:hypothetical protein